MPALQLGVGGFQNLLRHGVPSGQTNLLESNLTRGHFQRDPPGDGRITELEAWRTDVQIG
jgi:hypothetical protein